jgi:hypothetical protein
LEYGIGQKDEHTEEETGAVRGGDSLFGKLAMYRTKLNLTEEELMNKSWISLKLESADIPWYDYKAKKVISGEQAKKYLEKYIK